MLPANTLKGRRAGALGAALVGLLVAVGCDRFKASHDDRGTETKCVVAPHLASEVTWDAAAKQQAEAEGREVLTRHQCNRCHEIEDLAAPARELHCTSCHTFLKGLAPASDAFKKIASKYGDGILERYQRNIVHLERVPSLTGVARRVRTDWIRDFLREPYDVRPALEESMIRHHLTEGEIRSVVRYLAARSSAADPYAPGYVPPRLPERPSDERIAAGQKLFVAKGCPTCHSFGNLDLGGPPAALRKQAGPSSTLAPNLRFARDRTHPDVMLDWLCDSTHLAPGTLMPAQNIGGDEAKALRDFLLWADPKVAPEEAATTPPLPPAATRPVSYEEMKEAVLGRVCVHCHMNDFEKDKGPGNKGGFGYQGTGLAMRTYEALVNGSVGPDGQRRSVLVPPAGQSVPLILQVMLQRRAEEVRDHVETGHDHVRPHYPAGMMLGMPMGLPSMSDEQFGLLRAWIEQGCHGPTRVTGQTGVNDGYLVADGPLRRNEGCELRGPESPRPAWAYAEAAPHPGGSASGLSGGGASVPASASARHP